jgi:hypothetical protein
LINGICSSGIVGQLFGPIETFSYSYCVTVNGKVLAGFSVGCTIC